LQYYPSRWKRFSVAARPSYINLSEVPTCAPNGVTPSLTKQYYLDENNGLLINLKVTRRVVT